MTQIIDPEFEKILPELTADELQQLEANLLREGCRDPIVVWRGQGVILSGHHRYAICEKHGMTFPTVEIDLPDRDAAKAWIIQEQLGRRNLTPFQRAELALLLKPLIAAKAKERMTAGKPDPMQSSSRGTTRDELAKIVGVSHDTIHKAEVISEHAPESVKQDLRRGKRSVNAEFNRVADMVVGRLKRWKPEIINVAVREVPPVEPQKDKCSVCGNDAFQRVDPRCAEHITFETSSSDTTAAPWARFIEHVDAAYTILRTIFKSAERETTPIDPKQAEFAARRVGRLVSLSTQLSSLMIRKQMRSGKRR